MLVNTFAVPRAVRPAGGIAEDGLLIALPVARVRRRRKCNPEEGICSCVVTATIMSSQTLIVRRAKTVGQRADREKRSPPQ